MAVDPTDRPDHLDMLDELDDRLGTYQRITKILDAVAAMDDIDAVHALESVSMLIVTAHKMALNREQMVQAFKRGAAQAGIQV